MPEPAGRVALVGAGPGDPGLLTARAMELIAAADVILYDRLIPAAALDGARDAAELLFVGKEGGGASVPQEETETLMIARARAGLQVVRLKGGDPFVFGRGGEEARVLRDQGISYEVVPGITSGIAAPAYAGIPVTHRDHASAVALVTGHTQSEGPEGDGASAALDWAALAAFPGTLVFYMGVRQLPHIADSLIASGRSPREPAAVVQRGTLADQRTVSGTLATIAAEAQRAGVRPPSITVVGSVAALAAELAWTPERPLCGRTVAVTRARAQASALAGRLRELGARVVEAPVIRQRSLTARVPDLGGFDLLCLTSPLGVHELFERLDSDGRDARALSGLRVAAIGPGTARALAEHGVRADVVPERFVAEGLVEALAGVSARRVLIARARDAREVLPDALRARGAQVDVLALYETVAEALDEDILKATQGANYVTFTSSSTVRFFLEAAGSAAALSQSTRLVSIGPVTSEALRDAGLSAHVEAARPDVDGLIAALVADAQSGV